MIWRWLGFFVATVSVTWLVLLWRFQNRTDVSEAALWAYFTVLPVALFVLLCGFIWAFKHAYASYQKAAASQLSKTPPESEQPQAEQGTAPQQTSTTYPAAVVFAAARTMAGQNATEILDAIKKNTFFPKPDTELVDWQGMPVVAARIDGLDDEVESVAHAYLEATSLDDSNGMSPDLPSYLARSMAVVSPLLQEALATVGRMALNKMADNVDETIQTYHSALLVPPRVQSKRTLHVLVAMDEHWPTQSTNTFQHWLEHMLHKHGAFLEHRYTLEVVYGSEAIWQAVRRFLAAQHTISAEGQSLLMLVGSHSDLDEELIARYESKGMLFSAQDSPQGIVPGEAAAVLLLDPHHNTEKEPDSDAGVMPLLYTPEICYCDSVTVDTAARSEALVQALQVALKAAAVDEKMVGCIQTDADRHSRKATELFGMTLAVLPQLDPVEHIGMAGISGGNMGVVASLIPCALAAETVRSTNAPCVFVSLQNSRVRVAGCVNFNA